MGKIRKYKNAIERFLSGENGQRFFNFAYSIGAAIVIWGALFKILHLPGGNLLLCVGMGTEVLMFILTAFDRPGRDYHWEEVFPVLDSHDPDDRPDLVHPDINAMPVATRQQPADSATNSTATVAPQAGTNNTVVNVISGDPEQATELAEATTVYRDQLQQIASEMAQLKATTEQLNQVSDVLLQSYRAITENSENITASSTGYVDQMQALNRNISGLNTIYEIQLKSVSSQLDAIDRVNQGIKHISQMYEDTAARSESYCRETEKMAENMRRLNNVYEKMLHAMTINMYRPTSPEPPEFDADSKS